MTGMLGFGRKKKVMEKTEMKIIFCEDHSLKII